MNLAKTHCRTDSVKLPSLWEKPQALLKHAPSQTLSQPFQVKACSFTKYRLCQSIKSKTDSTTESFTQTQSLPYSITPEASLKQTLAQDSVFVSQIVSLIFISKGLRLY